MLKGSGHFSGLCYTRLSQFAFRAADHTGSERAVCLLRLQSFLQYCSIGYETLAPRKGIEILC